MDEYKYREVFCAFSRLRSVVYRSLSPYVRAEGAHSNRS